MSRGAGGAKVEILKRRRDAIEIIGEILSVTVEGAGKTAIMYRANLNFSRTGRYISELVGAGLISTVSESPTRFKITEKGLRVLRSINDLKRLWG